MADKIVLKGFLKIYRGDKLIRDLGANIILNSYRIALTKLMAQETGLENIPTGLRVFQGVEEALSAVDGVIPYSIALDNRGAKLDGQWATPYSEQGDWEILETDRDTYVNSPNYIQIPKYSSKNKDNNVVTTNFNLAEHHAANERVVSRATLISRDGQPLATKNFKGFTLSGNNINFDWSIVF